MFKIFVFVVLAAVLSLVHGKAEVTKLGMCDPNGDYKIKFNSKIKTEGDKQIVEEGSLTTDIDVGDNVMNSLNIEMFDEDTKAYKFLTKVDITYCEFVKKYMGDFSDALMEASGIKKGTCPIPKGTYKLINHPLDFSMVKGKDEVPDGKFRLKNMMTDSKTNDPLGCMEIDFTVERK